jgi:large-conductance mechanosensitive channel
LLDFFGAVGGPARGFLVGDFVETIVALVILWLILKAVFLLLAAVWEEVKPVVIFVVELLGKLLALLFAPFVALYRLIFGYPETEQEALERERREREAQELETSEFRRQKELEAIKKALKIE